jgi:hypothetical protein
MDDGNDLIRNLLAERLRPDPALKMMDRCELRWENGLRSGPLQRHSSVSCPMENAERDYRP